MFEMKVASLNGIRVVEMSGIRGLNLTTAGQVNNGTLLSSLYTVMAAIQTYGRY